MSKRKNLTIFNYYDKKSRPEISEVTASSTNVSFSVEQKCDTSVEENVSSITKSDECESGPQSVTSHPYDIGLFSEDSTCEDKKLDILKNVWEPNPAFVFPEKGKRKLKFQYKWLYRWKWLAYSEVKGGAFCKFCVLFAPSGAGSGKQPLGQLCNVKFDNWKKAVERFSEHEKCLYHKKSIETAGTLNDILLGKMKPVDEQVDSAASRRKLENRKNITPIIETILFCGNQGLALRGHKDSGRIDLDEQPGEENDGNFRALLRFRSKNDSTLKNILESSSKNAQYTSPRFQNEVIEVCNILILQKLVSKINDATCFSILADETTDIGGIEQLSLCVRYVDKENFNITEQFLQFIPVHDLTGKAIATTILDQLQSMKVDIKKLRGQGYDGAASMSGKINGVQAHVRSIVPSALYVHCSAHSLNLAVSNACEITGIRNCLGTIKTLYDFLNTPKRQYVLSSAIEEMETSSKREKIKQLCATRWMERYDSVTAVVELFEPIVETLQKISEWKDKESATQANSLLCTVSNCQFVISLLCIHKVFTITIHLCRYLQKTSIDLIEAVSLAEDVINELKLMRENGTETFSEIFSSSSLMLTSIGSSIQIPRITGRQKNRANFPTSTPETYFRVSVFIPFIENFITQLDLRFVSHRDILKGFQCLLPADPFICQPSNIKAFEALVEFYAQDLDTCKESLKSELNLWYKRLKRISEDGGSVPKTAADALGMCNKDITPNIFKLLEILVVLPVSTSANERSFSTLRRLKTYLRNSTGNNRMNGLALLNIHRKFTPAVEDILNELAKKPRRLDITV